MRSFLKSVGFFFLACVALVFSPILLFWSKHLLQWFFDYQIKASLQKTLSSAVDDKGNIHIDPNSTLLTWLMLAACCAKETRSFSYEDLFSYQFSDGASLADYLFKEIEALDKAAAKRPLYQRQGSDLQDPIVANNHQLANIAKRFSRKGRDNYLSRQSIILNLILLYQTQTNHHDTMHDDLNPTTLSFVQRFILWWFKGKLDAPYSQFGAPGFTKVTVLEPLAAQMSDIKLASERYSPKDLLNPDVIQSHLTKKLHRNRDRDNASTVDYKQPAGKVIEISLDEAITHEAVVTQAIQLDIESELATVEATQQHRWIDDSAIRSADSRQHEFASGMAARWTLLLNHDLKENGGSLDISQNAMDALSLLNDYMVTFNFRTLSTFDKDNLPLGMFIEEASHKTTIKFSPEYRIHQLRTNPMAYLMLDPLAIKGQIATIKALKSSAHLVITPTDVMSALANYHFTPDLQCKIERNLTYFAKDKKIYRNMKVPEDVLATFEPRKYPILRALQDMIHASSAEPDFIDFFFTMLDRYRAKTISVSNGSGEEKKENLLDFFAENFLCYLTRADAFHSSEAREYLQRLADEEDNVFFRILADIVSGEGFKAYSFIEQTYTPNFVQTMRRVCYFRQFLNELNDVI